MRVRQSYVRASPFSSAHNYVLAKPSEWVAFLGQPMSRYSGSQSSRPSLSSLREEPWQAPPLCHTNRLVDSPTRASEWQKSDSRFSAVPCIPVHSRSCRETSRPVFPVLRGSLRLHLSRNPFGHFPLVPSCSTSIRATTQLSLFSLFP